MPEHFWRCVMWHQIFINSLFDPVESNAKTRHVCRKYMLRKMQLWKVSSPGFTVWLAFLFVLSGVKSMLIPGQKLVSLALLLLLVILKCHLCVQWIQWSMRIVKWLCFISTRPLATLRSASFSPIILTVVEHFLQWRPFAVPFTIWHQTQNVTMLMYFNIDQHIGWRD